MSHIANNLLKLLTINELTELELSKRIGVGQPILSRIINGKTNSPKIDTLIRIANYFLISVSELVGQTALNFDQLNPATSLFHQAWCKVRLIEWDEILLFQQKKLINKKEKYILTDIETENSLYALILRSSAMEPKFPNGSVLVCSTNVQVSDGDNVIVQFSDQKTPVLRQVVVDGDLIFLSTLNNLSRDVRQYSTKDKILGVVVQVRLDIKSA